MELAQNLPRYGEMERWSNNQPENELFSNNKASKFRKKMTNKWKMSQNKAKELTYFSFDGWIWREVPFFREVYDAILALYGKLKAVFGQLRKKYETKNKTQKTPH